MHCEACSAPMRDTCPCRCCGPLWECTECEALSPCFGDCPECKAEEAAAETT